uniref:Complexin 3 n=1 Tax=Zonotrichia albicollis TaxID=44394 RepID=A0A8D2QJ31_ZONAL
MRNGSAARGKANGEINHLGASFPSSLHPLIVPPTLPPGGPPASPGKAEGMGELQNLSGGLCLSLHPCKTRAERASPPRGAGSEAMERDAQFAQRKAERATVRSHFRDKYRLPKNETDDNQIQLVGGDVELPKELAKMIEQDNEEEEEKNSVIGQLMFLPSCAVPVPWYCYNRWNKYQEMSMHLLFSPSSASLGKFFWFWGKNIHIFLAAESQRKVLSWLRSHLGLRRCYKQLIGCSQV